MVFLTNTPTNRELSMSPLPGVPIFPFAARYFCSVAGCKDASGQPYDFYFYGRCFFTFLLYRCKSQFLGLSVYRSFFFCYFIFKITCWSVIFLIRAIDSALLKDFTDIQHTTDFRNISFFFFLMIYG